MSSPRTLMIPIDGVDTRKNKWPIFELDVDRTPPGFTYSHIGKLELEVP